MNSLLIPLLIASAVGYLLSGALFVVKRKSVAYTALGTAWLVNAVVLVVNGLIVKDIPLGNMYQVQVVLSLCFVPLFILFCLKDKLSWTGVYFAVASALPVIGAVFMDKQATWKRMPALQSNWFVPHVLAYMISYALCAVAFIMLIRILCSKEKQELSRAVYQILRAAFPFMTFGMLSGALWAEEAWGQYWSWDAKEVWSLITWGLYLIYFHCRKSVWNRYVDWVHLLAFLALLTTFFLVNLLPKLGSLLHSYA